MSAAYDFVLEVAELTPIFTASPSTQAGHEFQRPKGWAHLTRENNQERLKSWQKRDAVMALLGEVAAVVDVDTKNGADIEHTRQWLEGIGVKVYAEVQTPSGGRHFWVPGHPDLPTKHQLPGLPGVEVLSHGSNVFLPGTRRPKYDGDEYHVVWSHLPKLADGGDPTSGEALVGWVSDNTTQESDRTPSSPPWDGTPPTRREAAYLDGVVRNQAHRVATAEQGGRNTALNFAAYSCGRFIAGAGLEEERVVSSLLEAATTCGLVAEDGEKACLATIRSGLRGGRQRPRAVPDPQLPTPSGQGPFILLRGLLDQLVEWQDLPDPTHIIATLAAAATRHMDTEPCWLLLVAPPSSGKTEAVRLLDAAADARLDEVTAAGLLGWSRGKVCKPTGVLARVGDHALATFGDLSTLLATSDRGGRDQVFSLLRRTYDGHVTRDIAPPSKVAEGAPDHLSWSGRLTVVGCVTGAIDRYTAHADQLGARWVYVRLPERSTQARRRAIALARKGGEQRRRQARETTQAILAAVSPELPDLPEGVDGAIEDAALVTCWGRAAVPRHGYGRRDIEGLPVVEHPMRLVQQLAGIARGVLALGLPVQAAETVARRVALDSMPEPRRAVLEALATGEVLSTSGVARTAQIDPKVARFQLEELAAIGVVSHDRAEVEEEEEPPSTRPKNWALHGDDGDLIAHVINQHAASSTSDEMWVYTSTSPQREKEEGEENPHTSGGIPTFRPKSEEPPCPTCGSPTDHNLLDTTGACMACAAAQKPTTIHDKRSSA